ncbi:MAG: hypothetical protein KBD64_03820 [Gammaproteobacteria bacterium]|nr:hypothetical protein [Gammaproteobacteria bacterium]
MVKKIILDDFEQDIEDNFEELVPIPHMDQEVAKIFNTARQHASRRKSITLRVHETDLETMRLKASKLGIPYQTYINMLIHKDASAGF